MSDDIVSRAKALAIRAHAGQIDKAGRPYIEHVARVAEAVREDGRCLNDDCNGRGEIVHWDTTGCGDPSCCSPATSPCQDCDEAEAVAWMHDVLEDCPDFREDVLSFPPRIQSLVQILSRDGYTYPSEYYPVVRSQSVTLRVKLADIADNADEERLALLDAKTANRLRAKYKKAVEALTGERNA